MITKITLRSRDLTQIEPLAKQFDNITLFKFNNYLPQPVVPLMYGNDPAVLFTTL